MLYIQKYSIVSEGLLPMHKGLTLVAISLISVASPVLAQMDNHAEPANCPATPAPLPAELAGWASPEKTRAANTADTASAVELILGQASDLELYPTPEVTYAIRPARPAGSVSKGGLAAFRIDTAGTYRIAIDSAAWLDVVHDGKTLESVNHGRGPDCSGIRKMVDFKLQPGIYTLQIVGNGTANLRVMLANVPAK